MPPSARAAVLVGLLVTACAVPFTVPALAATVLTPESFLGHPVGADRKLADYGQIVRYFEALDAGSDRLELRRLGKTTLGRDLVMAIVSSEANVRDVERYRAIAARLADPRRLAADEARRLAAEGKVIVLVTCNIHSSEIASSQMAMEWAHQLVTTENPEVRRWLDDVILLLMPSINPDGTDMIVDYYRTYAGTEWEGGRLPWLYHHYAGHDNNRDWYMLNLAETRIVNRVMHHDWFPQVLLDEHQMGAATPRMFVPPFADPHAVFSHPLQWRLTDLFGTAMALRLEQHKKSGVIDSYAYDAYWPGGTRTAAFKNVIGLLTEVASARIATPVYVDPGELAGGRKGLPDYKPQMNFPNPWPGGWWRLRDIVDYELIASNSLLETCSRHRAELLQAFDDMGRDAVRRGEQETPFAYLIPFQQHDPAAAAALVDVLRENGLDAEVARQPFTLGTVGAFDAGTVVFRAAQPYRAFLVEMMERQRYPEVRQGPDTREIFRPYDVTAWTLPYLMGVTSVRVDQPFTTALDPFTASPWIKGRTEGEGAAWVVRASSDDALRLANRLLARGVLVERARASFVANSLEFASGDLVVSGPNAALAQKLAQDLTVELHGQSEKPTVSRSRLRTPRLAMYKPWAASMDEGWTRLVLDRHEFKFTSLDNAAIKKGLAGRYDVVILPDVAKDVIIDGREKPTDGATAYFEPLPPPYAGGIGKDGVAKLKEFVEKGGTLVCLANSSDLPIEEMDLPVRNLVAKVRPVDFSLPGTLVHVAIDADHPLGYGLPSDVAAYFSGGPVFGTSIPGARVGRSVVGRYPAHQDDIIASGWGVGLERMAGRAAVVEARLGQGRVILFGPRVQYRGQSMGTYKLLFNAIFRAGMEE